jgi:hypothetical protein
MNILSFWPWKKKVPEPPIAVFSEPAVITVKDIPTPPSTSTFCKSERFYIVRNQHSSNDHIQVYTKPEGAVSALLSRRADGDKDSVILECVVAQKLTASFEMMPYFGND